MYILYPQDIPPVAVFPELLFAAFHLVIGSITPVVIRDSLPNCCLLYPTISSMYSHLVRWFSLSIQAVWRETSNLPETRLRFLAERSSASAAAQWPWRKKTSGCWGCGPYVTVILSYTEIYWVILQLANWPHWRSDVYIYIHIIYIYTCYIYIHILYIHLIRLYIYIRHCLVEGPPIGAS
jgi:hypothetical protein